MLSITMSFSGPLWSPQDETMIAKAATIPGAEDAATDFATRFTLVTRMIRERLANNGR
jgi:hypothetical protein